jgi:Ca-activated chloride channel family protein
MVIEKNITKMRSVNILMICALLFLSVMLNAQSDKKYIRKGNKEYSKNSFSESEVLYRKAIDKNKQSADAVFNVGDALYKQNKFEDAGKQFIENVNLNEDRKKKSEGMYNLGNSLLKANKLEESIEAYKGSLKLRPDSKEAKYNLAYAQDLLKQQQQQQDKQKQDQNKDNKKDDQKKDQKDQNNKDKDQQKQNDSKQDKQQEKQEQKQDISKDDAQRLLNALANDEKNVQEKVKLAKAAKEKVRTVKNW